MNYREVKWTVSFHDAFEPDYRDLPTGVQDELLARLQLLAEVGPQLGRPNVDTLYGSSFPNMKELRFQCDGVWRFAFAFNPRQQAIVLVGGDKEGRKPKRFYKALIRTADERFASHLAGLKAKKSR